MKRQMKGIETERRAEQSKRLYTKLNCILLHLLLFPQATLLGSVWQLFEDREGWLGWTRQDGCSYILNTPPCCSLSGYGLNFDNCIVGLGDDVKSAFPLYS